MSVDLKNLFFLPLDLPNLAFKNFSSNFAAYCQTMPESSINTYSNGVQGKQSINKNYWDEWVCYTHVNGWDENFVKKYPDEHEILKSLPYEKLIRLYFFKQIKELDPHTDIVTGLYTDYPSAVRFWVINEELNSTFFFQRILKNGEIVRKFPSYPLDSKWWAMNSTSISHGSYMPTVSKEKIIMGIYGIPKYPEFLNMLEKSWSKYKNYSLSLEDFASDASD